MKTSTSLKCLLAFITLLLFSAQIGLAQPKVTLSNGDLDMDCNDILNVDRITGCNSDLIKFPDGLSILGGGLTINLGGITIWDIGINMNGFNLCDVGEIYGPLGGPLKIGPGGAEVDGELAGPLGGPLQIGPGGAECGGAIVGALGLPLGIGAPGVEVAGEIAGALGGPLRVGAPGMEVEGELFGFPGLPLRVGAPGVEVDGFFNIFFDLNVDGAATVQTELLALQLGGIDPGGLLIDGALVGALGALQLGPGGVEVDGSIFGPLGSPLLTGSGTRTPFLESPDGSPIVFHHDVLFNPSLYLQTSEVRTNILTSIDGIAPVEIPVETIVPRLSHTSGSIEVSVPLTGTTGPLQIAAPGIDVEGEIRGFGGGALLVGPAGAIVPGPILARGGIDNDLGDVVLLAPVASAFSATFSELTTSQIDNGGLTVQFLDPVDLSSGATFGPLGVASDVYNSSDGIIVPVHPAGARFEGPGVSSDVYDTVLLPHPMFPSGGEAPPGQFWVGDLRGDNITDRSGTGAPLLPFGFLGGAGSAAEADDGRFDSLTDRAGTGPPQLTFGFTGGAGSAAEADDGRFDNLTDRSGLAAPHFPFGGEAPSGQHWVGGDFRGDSFSDRLGTGPSLHQFGVRCGPGSHLEAEECRSDSYTDKSGTGSARFPNGLECDPGTHMEGDACRADEFTDRAGTGRAWFPHSAACAPGSPPFECDDVRADSFTDRAGTGPSTHPNGVDCPPGAAVWSDDGRFDSVTDRAGTGPPNFPQGGTFSSVTATSRMDSPFFGNNGSTAIAIDHFQFPQGLTCDGPAGFIGGISGSGGPLLVSGDTEIIGNVLVTGDVIATGNVVGSTSCCGGPSDIRYKRNITQIHNSLESLLRLQGVHYDWRTDEFPNKRFTNDRQIGFLAQDLEIIFPELVKTDKKGYKSVEYSKMTPILVEAIKDQQAIIETNKTHIASLTNEMDHLKKQNDQLNSRLERLEALVLNASTAEINKQ